MYRPYRKAKDYVFTNPLLLDTITDKKVLDIVDNMMPREVGIEIECDINYSYPEIYDANSHARMFRRIPGLLAIDNDGGEQRYRISSGIEGMKALYEICKLLKLYSKINNGSGIHYHIDFRDRYRLLSDQLDKLGDHGCRLYSLQWMIDRVKHWRYKGSYNPMYVSTAKKGIRLHSGNSTIEFRTGEMTFDYEVMIKRIISAQSVVKTLVFKVDSNSLSLKSPQASRSRAVYT